MIVTAGAMNRQTLKCPYRGAYHVIPIEILCHAVIDRVFPHAYHQCLIPWTRSQEPKRDGSLGIVWKKCVAGYLFLHEAKVRFVLVQRSNDIVTIMPGVRTYVVMIVAVGIGIVCYIEPMPSPMLAIAWGGEQLVYHFFIRKFIGVVDECGYFLR
jgi:hypothetical protein